MLGEDGTVATPDDDGTFDTFETSCDVAWTVCGSPSGTPEGSGASSSSTNRQQSKTGNDRKWRPSLGLGTFMVAASLAAAPSGNRATSKQELKKTSGDSTSGQSCRSLQL